MQAEIKSFHCPDIDDLENYRPKIFDNFSFYLEMTIGTKGEVGEEIFGVTICTPKSFTDEFTNSDVIIPIHRVFVFRYDFHQIKTKLKHFVETRSGNNWHEIALKISKVAYWEFEDYQP
jgi:hypothetical protein